MTEKQISDLNFIPQWGTRLKELREQHGYSRPKAAEIFGISESRLQNIELQRVSQVYADELFRMCSLYQVNISSFFRSESEEDTSAHVMLNQIIGKINHDFSYSQKSVLTEILHLLVNAAEIEENEHVISKKDVQTILERLLNPATPSRI